MKIFAVEYKSSLKRLVQYFEESRNKWKKRSSLYQKDKRELLIKVRDLERSKNKWKVECLMLRSEIKIIKKKKKKIQELYSIIMEI